jgi:hypothetical protein
MAAQEITTPFATPERAADVLGVSKTRAMKLIRWARQSSTQKRVGETESAPTHAHDQAIYRKSGNK